MGRIQVDNVLEVTVVHQMMDAQLNNILEHLEHILEEVDKITTIANIMEESAYENEINNEEVLGYENEIREEEESTNGNETSKEKEWEYDDQNVGLFL